MKAILYVAGRGSRLGPKYESRHKVLLSFGGKTLLEQHVEHLEKVGVTELVLITGHQREQIEEALLKLRKKTKIELSTRYNPDFLEGSVVSFYVSLPELENAKEAVLLMDGDVLYPDQILERLVRSKHRTVLVLDQEYSTADDDPVLVPVRGDKPIEFRKGWKGEADLVGESIGFFKVDPVDLPMLINETRLRAEKGRRNEPYEEVLRALVLAGRFFHEDVSGFPWTEIDFPGDVEKAETEVFPAISKLNS